MLASLTFAQPMPMPPAQPQLQPTYAAPAGPLPPGAAQPAPAQAPTQAQLAPLKEMFPSMDDEIIASVLAAKGGNVDEAITELLSMQ